ncbi:hypothetical protein ACJX0J_041042, partial [Zea mays]
NIESTISLHSTSPFPLWLCSWITAPSFTIGFTFTHGMDILLCISWNQSQDRNKQGRSASLMLIFKLLY